MEIPADVRELIDVLAASDGVVALVVGGSRATGEEDIHSDWDLGLYYRGDIDLEPLSSFGEVHPPGSWGRIMNGGAWLDVDGAKVDVLLRDVDVVEHWTLEAHRGRYDIDGLPGYVAGIPTYSVTAEVAGALVLTGSLVVQTTFPPALRESAPIIWRMRRDFSLTYAAAHARRGNVTGAVGQCTRAIFEEAHARRCEQAIWTLNEKRLLDGCGLHDATGVLSSPGASPAQLLASVERIAESLANR